eukprot:362760-Chlamydomonas_euryale.AAC.3
MPGQKSDLRRSLTALTAPASIHTAPRTGTDRIQRFRPRATFLIGVPVGDVGSGLQRSAYKKGCKGACEGAPEAVLSRLRRSRLAS